MIGLDYDGTLTPIVDDPNQALLAPHTRDAVKALSELPNTSVAIVSGRSVHDAYARVGVDGVYYAGNHGLQITGPGVCFLEPTATRIQRPLAWLASALTAGLAHIPGARVENKTLSISVHIRQVAAADKKKVLRHVQAAVAVAPETFRVTHGKEVYEMLPQVDWHKGSAMTWISTHLAKPNTLSLYLGDDRTDEDVFRSLPDAITVKVGEPGTTAARYHVADPFSVHEFLLWLNRVR